tara:strand:+ start:194 stop:1621 length:1428 start_codon:yes stop_codon:yes gene_type:complete
MNIDCYKSENFYDEMFGNDNKINAEYKQIYELLKDTNDEDILINKKKLDKSFLEQGITFTLNSIDNDKERILPFDQIPRIINKNDWQKIEHGLIQRITALNLFLYDIYTNKYIIKDKIIPENLLLSSNSYYNDFKDIIPNKNIFINISGSDIIRDKNDYYVLEDNLRCPSGVSYVLENRAAMKKVYSTLYSKLNVKPVNNYPNLLLQALRYISPNKSFHPTCVLLSPGIYNSAYYEHTFLAKHMGIEIVEGNDLISDDGFIYMKTTKGLVQVDVIYRRIDDQYIDPNYFRKDSLLGVPGLVESYRKGNVSIANAIGCGIADDKATYSFVPEMIKYYLDQDPILKNIPTYLPTNNSDKDYILNNMHELVIKSVNESGGYGMLIGCNAKKEEINQFQRLINKSPRNYIAQPIISLSRHPTICDDAIEGRHIDLRPFVLYGEKIQVLQGGLTRVALKKNSLVVNSSQGGGTKDTCVLN